MVLVIKNRAMGLYQLCYRTFYRQIFKFSKRLPEKFSSSLLPLRYTPRWPIGLTYYSLVKGVLQFGQSKVEHGTPG